MHIPPINEMTGRRVRVVASDIVYSGILIEVSEDAIELQGETQWITILMNNISSITVEDR